ncbi:MAG TPA: ATP-binding cassette domain-containing protein [Candidatus Thermoplasmatota archaeon]|nr:ATP-binding cassette domain-containing protein [Candidatus Thermoplasmatota archaeon]
MTLARVVGPGIDLSVTRGERILLRGPNGSGKTSILRALAGLPTPLPLRATAPRASLSPQDARDALVGLTVEGEFRLRRRATPARLAPLRHRASSALSSGEARRVALAAAEGAPLLLLDEPSEGLDDEGRLALRELVRLHEGAVVLADHGALFDDLATRVVSLGAQARAPLPPMPRAEGAPIVDVPATRVRDVTLPALRLGPGFHVVRGPNGCGKSTLLRSLAERVRGARLLLPHATDLLTRERVADECAPHPLVPDALRARHPLSLSGGEAQRVALAKVLGAHAPCYLLDEPEAHLDAEGRAVLVESIAARVKEGACVLAATHDEALAALAATEVRL